MLKLAYTSQYKKDLKLAKNRKKDTDKLDKIIEALLNEIPLAHKHHDHQLTGDYVGYRECHIEPDWLLIYKKAKGTLFLARTGTHSDLFE